MGVVSLGRHLADVATILVLGFAYVLVLSVGTAVTTVHRRVTSMFAPGEHDQGRVEEPAEISH